MSDQDKKSGDGASTPLPEAAMKKITDKPKVNKIIIESDGNVASLVTCDVTRFELKAILAELLDTIRRG